MHILELTANLFALIIAVVSAVTDARVRKIYNAVTYPGVLAGFSCSHSGCFTVPKRNHRFFIFPLRILVRIRLLFCFLLD